MEIELDEIECRADWVKIIGKLADEIMKKKGLQEGPKIYLWLESYYAGEVENCILPK